MFVENLTYIGTKTTRKVYVQSRLMAILFLVRDFSFHLIVLTFWRATTRHSALRDILPFCHSAIPPIRRSANLPFYHSVE